MRRLRRHRVSRGRRATTAGARPLAPALSKEYLAALGRRISARITRKGGAWIVDFSAGGTAA